MQPIYGFLASRQEDESNMGEEDGLYILSYCVVIHVATHGTVLYVFIYLPGVVQ